MKVCVASGAADPCPPAVSSNKSRAVIDLTTSPPHHLTTSPPHHPLPGVHCWQTPAITTDHDH